jgi:surface carbohydrate biosynthesis protein
VIIENDATPASLNFFLDARRLGFRIVALDEEAISVASNSWYVKQRINEDTLSQLDFLFTRGQGDMLAIKKKYPQLSNKLIVAGNPRLDILRPRRLQPNYDLDKAPILIMSRFSRSNPFAITRDHALKNSIRKFRLNKQNTTFYKAYLEHMHNIFDLFFPMVGRLAEKFKTEKIIVRPHPSENYSTWQSLADNYDNLSVNGLGTAEEHASIAKLVIHNGCTTGLEAALIGCPVFSYMPIVDNRYDVPLPNIVSSQFYNEDSLFDAIKNFQNQPIDSSINAKNTWEKIKFNWVGDKSDRLSVEIIIDTINDHLTNKLQNNINNRIARIWLKLQRFKRETINRFLHRKSTKWVKLGEAYKNQKFPPTKISEIQNILTSQGYKNISVHPFIYDWWSLQKRL